MRHLVGICAVIFVSASTATAAPVTIERIVVGASLSRGLEPVGPAINNKGDVAFSVLGTLSSPGRSIFAVIDGVLREVQAPSGADRVGAAFDINDAGDVAYVFGSPSTAGRQRIVIDNNGVKSIAADTDGPLRSLFFNSSGALAINNLGTVAFGATTDEAPGPRVIFKSEGGVVTEVAPKGQAFEANSSPSINDKGEIAVSVRSEDPDNLEFRVAVVSGEEINLTPISVGADEFVSRPLINNNSDFVYNVFSDSVRSIFLYSGGITTRLSIPDSLFVTGVFGFNDLGDILFTAFEGDTFSIRVFSDGLIRTLVSTGDSLDGKFISGLFVGVNSLNNNREVAFWARFPDFSEGIYIARFGDLAEIPAPPAIALFGAGLVAAGAVRRRRKVATAVN